MATFCQIGLNSTRYGRDTPKENNWDKLKFQDGDLDTTLYLIYTGLELERVFYPGHMSVVVVAI